MIIDQNLTERSMYLFYSTNVIVSSENKKYTGKKRVESLYDFQMICHLQNVYIMLQSE